MDLATIFSLIPIAERLIFDVGGQLIELNTSSISHDDIVKALEQSKSENWQVLQFKTASSITAAAVAQLAPAIQAPVAIASVE